MLTPKIKGNSQCKNVMLNTKTPGHGVSKSARSIRSNNANRQVRLKGLISADLAEAKKLLNQIFVTP